MTFVDCLLPGCVLEAGDHDGFELAVVGGACLAKLEGHLGWPFRALNASDGLSGRETERTEG